MEKRLIFVAMKALVTAAVFLAASVLSCSCKGEDPDKGKRIQFSGSSYVRKVEHAKDDYKYPEAGALQVYSPSLASRKYRPVRVDYNKKTPDYVDKTGNTFDAYWNKGEARILHYMEGYQPETATYGKYKTMVNKWGSSLVMPRQEATGRFYTKKIDGRWWIIDPEGYIHYERGFTSFRQGTSDRNKAAFMQRYGGNVQKWIAESWQEFAEMGFHSTGAFCTGNYDELIRYNKANPDKPLILCPSFSFLNQFKSQAKLSYPGGNSEYRAGLVFNSEWPAWCKEYVRSSAFDPYRDDPNCLGFFSDNEIIFNSNSIVLLKVFLALEDDNDPAKKAAVDFMVSRGHGADPVNVSTRLGQEFAGLCAEKYYSAVRAAIDEYAPGLLYVGSRLNGVPSYIPDVIQAAGRYCDIVSINYYSRWAPELDSAVQDWDRWAGKPFMVTEFYTKAVEDSDLSNNSGAGWCVRTQADRAYWYQHFTLGLLEAKNCIGWTWFKYQDDDYPDNSNKPANKGFYDNSYEVFPILAKFARQINFNVYDLIRYFDE